MWCRLLCCCILVVLPASINAQSRYLQIINDIPSIKKDPTIVAKDWKKMENLFKALINNAAKTLMPIVMDNIQDVNVTSTCVRDAVRLFSGIRKLQTWALRFVDSSAKGVDGFMTGMTFSYGAYDECVETIAVNRYAGKREEEVLFTGKYCTVRIQPALPKLDTFKEFQEFIAEVKDSYQNGTVFAYMADNSIYFEYSPFHLGLCIPSGCSVDDVNQVLSKVANYTSLDLRVKRCEVKEDIKFSPSIISAISLYSFAGFMVLLGTAVDVYSSYTKRKLKRKSVRLLVIFSLVSNFRKLVDTSSSSELLAFLNGIRFLSMTWVILGHTYFIPITLVLSGMEYVREMYQSFAQQLILNATLAVETFFFISGLLVCYVSTNYVKIAKREFNVKVYIIHRLFRIIPGYVFAIFLMFLVETMASGPSAYNILHPLSENCKKNWWTNLLFMNNFYDEEHMCMTHTWYLSADMQLYIGALIILLPLFRWPKVGVTVAVVCLISLLVSSGAIMYIRDYPVAPYLVLADKERMTDYLLDFYIKPYPHGSSYILGIMVGYLLATNPTLQIPKVLLWFGWPAAITCSMSAVFGSYPWNLGREQTLVETIMYGSLCRLAWTAGVAWMVICCAAGYGGIVRYILSLKMWIPLGRLTFMVYLVHFPIQYIFHAGTRQGFPALHSIFIWQFFGHLVISYAVGFVGAMLIESPLIAVEKILLSRHENETLKKSESGNGIKNTVKEDVDSLKTSPDVEQSWNGTKNSEGFVSKL